MLRSKTRWKLHPSRADEWERWSHEFGIHPIVAQLLAARGWNDKEKVLQLLSDGEPAFHDPFLLHGMQEAVTRIRQALEHREKILVFGDYDADGVSSTSFMVKLLGYLQADFSYHVPHRTLEGYGLNIKAIEQAQQDGIQLIITVDNGISAVEQVKYANSLGIDVVITDHHEPPAVLPEAFALVNPKLPYCSYPFKGLAGVGVAMKLAHALLGRVPVEWMDLVALGTVADLMPIVDENRSIVKLGLSRMRQSDSVGLRALLHQCGLEDKKLDAQHIGFALAPRLNSVGRLDSAMSGVELLVTDSVETAQRIALQMDQLNKERQRLVEEATNEAFAQIESEGRGTEHVLVVYGEQWNVGIVGIVASRIVERYYRPAFVLGLDPKTGMAKGSARSIPGFDLYHSLTAASELLEHFGGHQAAAGLTLQQSNIAPLRDRLLAYAAEVLTDEDLQPTMHIDLELRLDEVTTETIEQLDRLSPFGPEHPAPRILLRKQAVGDLRELGKEGQHLKLQLTAHDSPGKGLDAICFGWGSAAGRISPTAKLDVVGELAINEWNGLRKPQLMIHDLCIEQHQVFDWRGMTLGNGRLAQQLRLMDPSRPISRAVVVWSQEEAALAEQLFRFDEKVDIWIADEQGTVHAAMGQSISAHGPQELFLLTLPDSIDALRSVLHNRSGWERCFVILLPDGPMQNGEMPQRDHFKLVYKELAGIDRSFTLAQLIPELSRRTKLKAAQLEAILQVFIELQFIAATSNHEYYTVKQPAKKELSESASYQRMTRRFEAEQFFSYSTSQELTHWLLQQLQDNQQTQAELDDMEEIVS